MYFVRNNHIVIENSKLVDENNFIKKQLEESNQLKDQLSSKKQKAETHIRDIKNENEEKDKEKIDLISKVEKLEIDLEAEKKMRLLNENIRKWEKSKIAYIETEKSNLRRMYRMNAKYCRRPIITLFSTVVLLPLYLKFFDKIKINLANYKFGDYNDFVAPILIFIILVCIAFYEIIGRTYINDKEKVRDGLFWIFAFTKSSKIALIDSKTTEFGNNYIKENPMPQLK